MRKVFVLLFSSCISLVCGFIVPSGVPEFIDEDAAILAENDATKQDEMKLSTIDPGFVASPDDVMTNNNKNNLDKVREIDDKALYENSVNKENNLNERSYVYINQKFIPPARKGFHRSKQFENNTQTIQNIIPPIRKDITNKKPLPTLSYGFFQPSLNEMIIKDVNDNYILSKNNCEDCHKGKKAQGLKHRKYDKLNTNKGIDDELSYIELLKPPFVRTVNKNNKIKYNYPNSHNFASALVLNKNNYIDKKYSNSEISSNVNHKEINNYRRLHSLPNLDKENSDVSHKEDNLIFDDNTIDNSDQTYTGLEETPEERREMDRFQKNTYGEQVTDEKVNINYVDCNYKDCVQTNKKTQRKVTNSKCKCPINANSKGNNIQDIIGKGKIKANKTNVKMNLGWRPEESDYDNILVDSANKNLEDELTKTVNKLNYTLQMYR